MTPKHRAIVEKELRAIKRAIARIEASFEGVPKLLERPERTAAAVERRRRGKRSGLPCKRRPE
jgi:hypothetical protein